MTEIGFRYAIYRVNLAIDPSIAARVVALRPALEALIVKATTNPEALSEPDPRDSGLIEVVRSLSKISAGKHGVQQSEDRCATVSVFGSTSSLIYWSTSPFIVLMSVICAIP